MDSDRDIYDEGEPRRKRRTGCACGLDGYPGACPGADQCPYAPHEQEDEDEDDE